MRRATGGFGCWGQRVGWVLAVCLAGGAGTAAPVFRSAFNVPFTGGPGQLVGDITAGPGGAAAIYAKPVGTESHLAFYRFGPDAQLLVERVHSLMPWPCYEPALAFDGESYGVAVSAFTQAFFLRLSPAGDVVLAPVQLPGLPSGAEAGRTAAFKVIWTGEAYAVFGLWLEREYPWQELTQGYFYTHLRYWLLDRQGQVLAQQELRRLAPMVYPGVEGAERNYYDVAWTGAAFFVAYYGESQTGPPLSVYYRMFDLAGAAVRDESPLFAAQVAQGPRVAWNGRVVAATALKAISMPSPEAGNYMYVRIFGAEGVPRANESEYGQKLGYGPTVSWAGDRFLTVYCVMYDLGTLGYTLMFTGYDEAGAQLGPEAPLRNSLGQLVTGKMALGVDVQLVGTGNVIYAKAQNADAWGIKINPLWFTLHSDCVAAPALAAAPQGGGLELRWPADAAPFRLQESHSAGGGAWTDVTPVPEYVDGAYRLALTPPGTRFYRMIR